MVTNGNWNNNLLNPAFFHPTGLSNPTDGTGLVTVNGGDPLKVDISATTGTFVNEETGAAATAPFNGVVAHTPLNVGSGMPTFLNFDVGGNITESTTIDWDFLANNAMLGLATENGVGGLNVSNLSAVTRHSGSLSWHQQQSAIGSIKMSGGLVTANGANLFLDMDEGEFFSISSNSRNSVALPHTITLASITNGSMFEAWRSDGLNGQTIGLTATGIEAGIYDDGTATGAQRPQGTLLSNEWTVIRVYRLIGSDNLAIVYGQSKYSTEEDAIIGIASSPFTPLAGTANLIPRAAIVLRGAATDLTNLSDALIREVSKFGEFI